MNERDRNWLNQRHAEYDLLVALPKFRNLGWARYFKLNDHESKLEGLLSDECSKTGMLGVNRFEFVPDYGFCRRPEFDGQASTLMQAMNWDSQQIRAANAVLRQASDVRNRTIGAAGRLVVLPEFRRHCAELQVVWRALPEAIRPQMPLRQPATWSKPSDERQSALNDALVEFYRQFDDFCSRWRLLGMTTWDLPNACGPNLSGIDPLNPSPPTGASTFDIPPHFPLTNKRERMGDVVVEKHRRESSEMGFDDLGQWQKYANALRIHVLQRIAESRYRGRTRQKNAISGLRSILAGWLSMDEDRVKKLQAAFRNVLANRIESLRNVR